MDMDETEPFKIPQEHLDKLNDPEILRRYIEEGKTFQEILELDDQAMQNYYQASRGLLENHRHRDAADAFLFLTTLNPFVSAYWIGLGMCEQFQEEYKQALVAYSMATMSDRSNPVPLYYAAACHHSLGEVEQSLSLLARAIEVAGSEEEHSMIKERALSAQSTLSKKI